MILPILHPCPWATGKFATHGPHYVALWPEIAALGPRACGSMALWRQFPALGRHNVWPWGGKFSSIPRAGVQNYYNIHPICNVAIQKTQFGTAGRLDIG